MLINKVPLDYDPKREDMDMPHFESNSSLVSSAISYTHSPMNSLQVPPFKQTCGQAVKQSNCPFGLRGHTTVHNNPFQPSLQLHEPSMGLHVEFEEHWHAWTH
eukprot:scpid96947/ scgid20671/ 